MCYKTTARFSKNYVRFLSLFIVILILILAHSDGFAKDPRSTHLGVRSNQIVNIRTYNLPNDNTSHTFYYDRQNGAPFEVPKGYSFVITDIIVLPETYTISPDQGYLVVVTIGGARSFEARFFGSTQHYRLSGALVIPSEASVVGRNTTLSVGNAEVQLLGYFVQGKGLDVGVPVFE